MQKIAIRIFIYSSIAFDITGTLLVLTSPTADESSSDLNRVLMKLLLAIVFIILPSFALSIAGKYLKGKS